MAVFCKSALILWNSNSNFLTLKVAQYLKRNTYYAQNEINRSFLGPKSQLLKFFSKSLCYIFLKLYQIPGINEWVVNVLDL